MTDEPTTDKPTPRKNNPAYHVFRLTSGDPPVSTTTRPHWEQLTPAPIQAASRKMAVELALARAAASDKARSDSEEASRTATARAKGPFLVVPEKECWIKSKTSETKTVEVWS